MTYYGSKDLASSFRTVRKNTLIIANEIGEENYGFSPAPGSKTVAQTLVHIASATLFAETINGTPAVSSLQGYNFGPIMGAMMAAEQGASTKSKAEIIALLEASGEKFASWLETLSDEFLAEHVTMPAGASPASKTRFEMLLGPKEHEMHHRGQLMLIERMLGQVPHLTRDMQARMAAMQAAQTQQATA